MSRYSIKNGKIISLILMVFLFVSIPLTAQEFSVETIKDPVTGRTITWYKSPYHENHHYYCVNPWDPDEKHILFYQFDKSVAEMEPNKWYPGGSLWIMDNDGKNRKKLVDGLPGHYHVSTQQTWGPGGKYVVFFDNSIGRSGLGMVHIETGETEYFETPVRGTRTSPDLKKIACCSANEFGIYEIANKQYTRLVSKERVMALSPNKSLLKNNPSSLQNTRFSPDGSKIIIVHRTNENYPRVVEDRKSVV